MSDLGSLLVKAILIVPACSAVLLAVFPEGRFTARLNALGALLTFLASTGLFLARPDTGPFLIVDDVNVVFIVLTTFVGFTTSVFSATYIAHELESGHLTPVYLRFYHAMYQTLMFAMNLALLANNVGLMWVAVELATLTTVLMVSRCSVPYLSILRRARRSARGSTPWPGMCWCARQRRSIRRCSILPSYFCFWVTARK